MRRYRYKQGAVDRWFATKLIVVLLVPTALLLGWFLKDRWCPVSVDGRCLSIDEAQRLRR